MRQDLRYAVRSLRRHPSFTLLAVAALAIGIGANTAIFSVVDTVLLRPLPYADADRLVMLWATDTRLGAEGISPVAPGDFTDWRAQARSFDALAATSDAVYNLTGAGDPEMLICYSFDVSVFPLLGIRPQLGRWFTADDGAQVVVLSEGLWKRRFAADPAIVGRKITLDQQSYTVVGVMPASFRHPGEVALWTPLTIPPEAAHSREWTMLRIVGHLAPGVSLEQAGAEMRALGARLASSFPDTNRYRGAHVQTLRDLNVGGIRPTLLVLLGAVGLVLLLVCNNIASLLLARAQGRQREIAIRAALGASRPRIVRQLLTESLVLSVLGGALGLVVALWSVSALVNLFPKSIGNLHIPRIDHIPIDARVLIFTFLASVVTGVLFGLAPAFAASRVDLEQALRESTPSASVRGSRARRLLVAGEIALALVLAAGAGLLARSFQRIASEDLGFAPHGVLTARTILSERRYPRPEQGQQFLEQVLARLRALPGVEAAGAVSTIPLSRWWAETSFNLEGRPQDEYTGLFNVVEPGYFPALKIPLLRGRNFDRGDGPGVPEVCIVDQTLARRFFGLDGALGRRLNFGTAQKPQWRTIVGVVADIRQFGPAEERRPTVYVPFTQKSRPLLGFVVRTSGSPTQMAGALRQAVWSVDGDQPLSYVMTLDALVAETLTTRRVTLWVLAVFAGIGLLLSALGVYGVMAFAVAQRRREIGIRIALGADRRAVARLVLGQAARVAAIGVAVGLVLALALGRLLASLLYQVGASDPLTFGATAVVITAVALLAAWLPARAAMRTNPMVALRNE